MNLIEVLKTINFTDRYKDLCIKYDNFSNTLNGNDTVLYEKKLALFGNYVTYNRSEKFYKVEKVVGEFTVILHLSLKGGVVEPILYVRRFDVSITPRGRFDFIPEQMGVDFDQEKYNLLAYSSGKELEEILKELFSIYQDIISELLRYS